MENNFVLETDFEGVYFVGNRETGEWGLSNLDNTNNALKGSSRVFSEKPFKGVAMIALNMGRKCNFDCTYCLVGDLKNEGIRMSEKVGIKAIERIIELNSKKLQVVFHGSEPMMNYSLIKKLVSYANNSRIQFCMQSNGSLFNSKNLKFLSENNVGIGISIDGLKEHQNKTRRYKNNLSSYKIVRENISKVNNKQKGVSVISVITKDNVSDMVRIVESFEESNLRSVLFCPVNPNEDYSIVPNQKELSSNMKKIFDRFLNRRVQNKKTTQIANLRNYLRTFFKPKTTSNCVQCGAGINQPLIAIDVEGSIYPCDYFWGKEDYKIGNIFETSLEEALNSNSNFRNYRNVKNIEDCNFCDWERFCGGGCPGGSVASGRGLEKKSLYCDYNKEIFEYIARKIPLIHSKGLIRELLEG